MPVLKRAGIYAYPGERDAEAFIEGIARHGVRPFLRNPDPIDRSQIEPFDLVFVSGARGARALTRDFYLARGVPVVVGDLGYLRRFHNTGDDPEAGYWQLGLGGLNTVPPFACDGDRFRRLRLPIGEGETIPPGVALIAAQMPDDASHGFSEADLVHAYRGMAALLAGQGFEVVFRPHPRHPMAPPPEAHRVSTGSIWSALVDASILVTLSSNAGHDALILGRPVSALINLVPYGEFVTPIGAASRARLAPVAERRAYFERVAYAQWTLAEIRRGEAIEFLLSSIERGHRTWKSL